MSKDSWGETEAPRTRYVTGQSMTCQFCYPRMVEGGDLVHHIKCPAREGQRQENGWGGVIPRIKEWSLQTRGGKWVISGRIYSHPTASDGIGIVTSALVRIDFEKKIAETKNSLYRLEDDL